MNLEQHPEEMLDRAIAGEILGSEQTVLDDHLAACRVCAAHLAIARSRQETGGGQHWDNQLNHQAVEHALASFERTRWPSVFAFLTRKRWLLLAAGILLTLGSAASAAWWRMQRPAHEVVFAHGAAPPPLALAPTPFRPSMAAPEEASDLAPALPDERALAPHASRALPTAASLFEQASALRDQNRPDEAIIAFRRLQHLFPRAKESRMSFALVGRMLLDRGRPAQALAQFDQHLAQNGEASEEALAGRATALARMGRFSSESETWRKLLDAYPGSVYAGQARERLSQLQVSPKVPAGIEHSR